MLNVDEALEDEGIADVFTNSDKAAIKFASTGSEDKDEEGEGDEGAGEGERGEMIPVPPFDSFCVIAVIFTRVFSAAATAVCARSSNCCSAVAMACESNWALSC